MAQRAHRGCSEGACLHACHGIALVDFSPASSPPASRQFMHFGRPVIRHHRLHHNRHDRRTCKSDSLQMRVTLVELVTGSREPSQSACDRADEAPPSVAFRSSECIDWVSCRMGRGGVVLVGQGSRSIGATWKVNYRKYCMSYWRKCITNHGRRLRYQLANADIAMYTYV